MWGTSTTGGGSYASEIHTISPVYRIGKGRIFLHILIHVLDGMREFVVNIFAVSFYISCLQEGDGKRFFAGLLFFCGINLALRGVSRWYRECYSEQADILQEGRIVRRIEERAAAVPYASYEKTAFLNRLEYLANNASATYEKIMGNIGNTVRLASALIAVLTYLATLDPVLFAVAIAPFLLTLVLRRQGTVRHDYEVEKSVHDRKKAYVWRKSEKCRMTKSRNPGQQAAGRFLKFRWSMSILDTGRKRFCRISVFGGTKTEDCAGARLLLQYGIFDCR